jgi:hypothetical protein
VFGELHHVPWNVSNYTPIRQYFKPHSIE